LRGYRLRGESYEPIADKPLQLRLAVEGGGTDRFYRKIPEKLLIPDELVEALQEEIKARQQARERAEQAEALLARYRERFGELPEIACSLLNEAIAVVSLRNEV